MYLFTKSFRITFKASNETSSQRFGDFVTDSKSREQHTSMPLFPVQYGLLGELVEISLGVKIITYQSFK